MRAQPAIQRSFRPIRMPLHTGESWRKRRRDNRYPCLSAKLEGPSIAALQMPAKGCVPVCEPVDVLAFHARHTSGSDLRAGGLRRNALTPRKAAARHLKMRG